VTLAAAFSQTQKPAESKDSSEQAVLQAIQTWLEADEHQDRATLNKIIGDDFIGTAPRGRVVNKRDNIPEEGTTGGHGLSITAQDIKVRILGDTAIAIGRGLPKTQGPEARPELRFTVVFAKRADHWQMVAAHLSPLLSN
jgi:ketosteroid isomerase-like protein